MNLILTKIKSIFPYHKILLAYYCGSQAYSINNDQSDIDVTVVLEDFNGIMQFNTGQLDLFIFSKEDFLDRYKFDKHIIAYHKFSADTLLSLDRTLIHIDAEFKETVDKLLDINHTDFLKGLLIAGLEYGKSRYEVAKSCKSHYHFLRYRAMIEHFEKTGKCELVFPEPWRTYMLDFKNNWDNVKGSQYYELIEESIGFIEKYIEGMT